MFRFPMATALLVATAAAALAQSPPPELFELQEALFEAGKHVPRDVQEYYFFEIEPAMETAAATDELEDLLRATHEEHGYIGIYGREAARNLAIVRGSLSRLDAGSIDHATIIYLGPGEQRAVLEALVRPTGARLIYDVYPAAAE